MANLRLASAAQNAMLTAIRNLIDAGSAGGTIKLYTAPQPAGPDTAVTTQTLLATLRFADPAAPAPAAGVLTFAAVTEDGDAAASGTAAWARIADSSGAAVFDCDVGTSGATINLNSTAITVGDIVRVTSFVLTQAAG